MADGINDSIVESVPAGEVTPEPVSIEPTSSILTDGETPQDGDSGETSTILTDGKDGVTPSTPSTPPNGEEQDKPAETTAPEAYDFKVSEEYSLTPEIVEAVSPVLKKYNLTQEAAQELADVHMDLLRKQNEAMYSAQAAQVAAWKEEAQKDPEFGGANYEKNVGLARVALKHMISDNKQEAETLRDILDGSGMGNHPAVLKAFARIGKLISEDSVLGKGEMGGRSKGFDPETDMFATSLGKNI